MNDGLSVLLICGLSFFLFISFIGIMYFFLDRNQRRKKFIEYEYPGRRRKINKIRSSENVIASFKDLAVDDRKQQCYKLLITEDKVYLIQYFYDNDQTNSLYPNIVSLVLDLLINVIFKKQVRDIARSLDKGRLEKSNSIPKLLEKTNYFYELERSMVRLKLGYQNLRMNHKGIYRYGKKGKGPDDLLSAKMPLNKVDFYYDKKYYQEYKKLVSTYFPDY